MQFLYILRYGYLGALSVSYQGDAGTGEEESSHIRERGKPAFKLPELTQETTKVVVHGLWITGEQSGELQF